MNARRLTLPLAFVLTASTVASAEPLGSPADYLAVASIAGQRGEWKTAERIVRDGMDAHPESDGFHLGLAYVLEQQGRITEAFYEYQYEVVRAEDERLAKEAARKSALILERKDADEPRRVMAALALAQTDPAAARAQLSTIRTKGDRPFVLRLYEAECAELARDLATAEAGFRALIASDAHFKPAYLALARILNQTGRHDEAMRTRVKGR